MQAETCLIPYLCPQINCGPMPPGPSNPFGTGMFVEEKVLKTELKAQRNINTAKSRMWMVKNENSHNPVTGNTFSDDPDSLVSSFQSC